MNEQPRPKDLHAERRAQILTAAQACFVRSGFHRTTMQDVAKEAGMSPGNLYRYFESKDAIVAGLARADQERIAEDFAAAASNPDFLPAFAELGRKYLIDEPRDTAVMALEIWAESTRNEVIAAVLHGIVEEVRSGMASVLEAARKRGSIPASLDIDRAVRFLLAVSDGMMKRRALAPNFEGERELETMLAVLGAVLRGRVPLTHEGSETDR